MHKFPYEPTILTVKQVVRNGDRMEQSNKITVFQMTLLLMSAVGLKNHVIVIPSLLNSGGRDSWIGVLVVAGLTLVWSLLLLYIYRAIKGQHIGNWLADNIGEKFSLLFRTVIGVYVVIMVCVTLRETITWTNVSYLWRTPPLALTLLFLIPCVLAAMTSLRAIAIANFFLLLLVVLLGHFVATANLQFKDYSLLFPLFEDGFGPLFHSLIYQASGMVELIIIILFQHQFHTTLRYRHFVINTAILTILSLGPLTGAIIEFGPEEAAAQRYPAYEEWALVRVGNYIEHVDYLSIYQWLSGAFIRITLLLYILRLMVNKKSTKVNVSVLAVAFVVITVAVVFPVDDLYFFDFLNYIALPTTFYVFFILSLIIGGCVFINNRRQKHQKGGGTIGKPNE